MKGLHQIKDTAPDNVLSVVENAPHSSAFKSPDRMVRHVMSLNIAMSMGLDWIGCVLCFAFVTLTATSLTITAELIFFRLCALLLFSRGFCTGENPSP
jgi:hypothetical protein